MMTVDCQLKLQTGTSKVLCRDVGRYGILGVLIYTEPPVLTSLFSSFEISGPESLDIFIENSGPGTKLTLIVFSREMYQKNQFNNFIVISDMYF